ncbi:helix-turn-helix transcriptional regulator [Paenibacillaceae bacterium WGS1546]|uniref:helix-turn-helix transcriptional regulator n=1 Tax=Cohnella sp. WGS1546 TaxID=3366810 RepID=UPI00372D70D8
MNRHPDKIGALINCRCSQVRASSPPCSQAVELLDSLRELGGEDAIHDLFLRQKEKLKEELLPFMFRDDLEGRIHALASYQDKRGYMTSLYRNEEETWILEEANCPIFQVATSFPHACQCERALFAEVLGAKVQRMECMAEGGRTCKYRIMTERGESRSEKCLLKETYLYSKFKSVNSLFYHGLYTDPHHPKVSQSSKKVLTTKNKIIKLYLTISFA